MHLTIESISKVYPNGVHALNNISLDITSGMFGLLGPNGAGKSSLMRTIATLQEPDSGTIRFEGMDVRKEKDNIRKVLGYLPQEFGVYPKISCRLMLDHIATMKGIRDKATRSNVVDSLLEKVNLQRFAKHDLETFSGGMRQRFGIAQALLGSPKLIIVDEPTAGLDPAERNRFYNLLSELGENAIVILSTHIVEDVSTLCSRFAILAESAIRFSGETENALRVLAGKVYLKTIERSELDDHNKRHKIISAQMKAGRLAIKVLNDTSPGEGFSLTAPSLEDVYFHFVNSTGVAKQQQD